MTDSVAPCTRKLRRTGGTNSLA